MAVGVGCGRRLAGVGGHGRGERRGGTPAGGRGRGSSAEWRVGVGLLGDGRGLAAQVPFGSAATRRARSVSDPFGGRTQGRLDGQLDRRPLLVEAVWPGVPVRRSSPFAGRSGVLTQVLPVKSRRDGRLQRGDLRVDVLAVADRPGHHPPGRSECQAVGCRRARCGGHSRGSRGRRRRRGRSTRQRRWPRRAGTETWEGSRLLLVRGVRIAWREAGRHRGPGGHLLTGGVARPVVFPQRKRGQGETVLMGG